MVFWSCMPMSPKPRVLTWLSPVAAMVDSAGVTGAAGAGGVGVAAATVGQSVPFVGVTSVTRSIVRALVTAGRSAKVIAMSRPAPARSINMAGKSQRFSMYMRDPPLCICVHTGPWKGNPISLRRSGFRTPTNLNGMAHARVTSKCQPHVADDIASTPRPQTLHLRLRVRGSGAAADYSATLLARFPASSCARAPPGCHPTT